jgi:Ca2+-binding RTX toxin-like protein
VNAGDGDDTVSGGSKRNIIDGGAGDDVLAGGPVNDDFYGGTGADRFTGGAGLDRVFYADHGAGVTADIEPTGPASADDGNSTDGPAGSRDDITASIETISGSGFADVISAAAAQAAATLFGRAGNDVLTDGPFDDLLNGNGGADTFNCTGGGDDTIAGLQAIDTVNGSC